MRMGVVVTSALALQCGITPGRPIEDAGFAAPANCRPTAIPADGQLNVNLVMHHLRGTVKLNGAPLPPIEGGGGGGESRGQLAFVDPVRGTSSLVSLGTTATPTLDVLLPAGEYTVLYVPFRSPFGAMSASVMPATAGVVLRGLSVRGDTMADVDLKTVQLRATLKLNGAPFPEFAPDVTGSIYLRSTDGIAPIATLRMGASSTLSAAVLRGDYSVSFTTNTCDMPLPAGIPCGNSEFQDTLSIQADLNTTIEMRTAQLTGTVKLNGAAIPQRNTESGELTFSRPGASSPSARVRLAQGSTGNFSLRLSHGPYRVEWVPTNGLCAQPDSGGLPCAAGTVVRELSIGGDRDVTIDLRTVRLSGQVTLGATPLTEAERVVGLVAVYGESGSPAATRLTALNANTGYSMALLAGKYDLVFSPSPTVCSQMRPMDVREVPCAEFSPRRAFELNSDLVEHIDLRPVELVLQLQGPGAQDANAILSVQGVATGARTGFVPSRVVGMGLRAITVQPGTYNFILTQSIQCSGFGGLMPGNTPCTTGLLRAEVPVMGATTVSLTIDSLRLNATVSLNGAALPETMIGGRGYLGLIGSNGISQFSLPSMGPATVDKPILPGSYIGFFSGSVGTCVVGTPATVFCGLSFVLGCTQ